MAEGQRLRLTQIKSGIGYDLTQKQTLRTLGLRRLNQTVEVSDSAAVRGMVKKVGHLLRIEEVTSES
jgi:large subunit ribosomal protein L30